MKNKIFTRIIITTLLVTFLTLNLGRVTRVSAVGTTTAIAGAAFIATGLVYMSYLALTGAQVSIPLAQDLHEWLGDVGRKVAQYPSGSHTYEEMYQYYAVQRDPIAVTIEGVWTWTEEKLKSFINDFSNTELIQEIVSYEMTLPVVPPALDYNYGFSFTPQNTVVNNYGTYYPTFQSYWGQNYTFEYPAGPRVIIRGGGYNIMFNMRTSQTIRNAHDVNGYFVQYLSGSTWQTLSTADLAIYAKTTGYTGYMTPQLPAYNPSYVMDWIPSNSHNYFSFSYRYNYPVIADAVLYDYVTGQTTEVVERSSTEVVNTPQWITDPDNDKRPIVPWVPIPQLPTGITPPSGYNNIDQWGFNLEDLLDDLADLGETIFDLSVLKELINAFAGQHGNQYYLYYDDGDDNYYYYYQPTNYNGDYVTYNIDISEQEDIIPVDLNTIQLYTENKYIDTVKFHAKSFGQMIGEYIVFWHNSDPETLYTILGSFVIILIGAFIGKWGHS